MASNPHERKEARATRQDRRERSFLKGVLALGTGTLLAQAIPLLVSPVLTRIYGPDEIGALAVYLSAVAVLAVLGSARLELAIPLARRANEAAALLRLCLALAFGSGLITLLVVWITHSFNGSWPGLLDLRQGLWLLPFGIGLACSSQALHYWCNRHGLYAAMAQARVTQAGITAGAQVGLGMLGAGSLALMVSSCAGQALHAALLSLKAWRNGAFRRRARTGTWRVVIRRHRRFPAYMVPGQLANVASVHLPVVLLAMWFGPAAAGYYALAERVLLTPASVIGSAVGDVYRQHAASAYHTQGNCRGLFLRTAGRLALMATVPLGVVLAAGPSLFEWVFGGFWRPAGEAAMVLAPLAFCQFISSPLSQTVLLANLHRTDMIWQFARLTIALAALGIARWLDTDAVTAVALYSGAFCLLYAAHSLLQYRAACGLPKSPIARASLEDR